MLAEGEPARYPHNQTGLDDLSIMLAMFRNPVHPVRVIYLSD